MCLTGEFHWHDFVQGVDRLPGGRHQPFYRVLVDADASERYVAQCNINLLVC